MFDRLFNQNTLFVVKIFFMFFLLTFNFLGGQLNMQNKQQKKQQNTRPSSGKSQLELLEQHKIKKFYIKESIYILYFLIRCSLGISILYFISQNQIISLTQSNSFQRMQENLILWKKDVIVDIKTVNSYNCPEGYQMYTSYEWPGIKQGCQCRTSLDTWDYIKILQGACSQLAINAGCLKIPAVKPIPYLFWKNSQLICLKRVKNLNFYTKIQNASLIQNCSIHQPYQFDSVSNLTLSLCPITVLADTPIYGELIPSINFSFSRQTSYPVADIKMTEYQFCDVYNKQNISPSKQGQTNYNLQLQTRSYCPKNDPRVIVFDKINQDELTKNNPRILDVIKNIPAYPEPSSDYNYLLGFVRYPAWTYSCRQSQQYNLVNSQNHLNLQNIQTSTKLYLIISSIFVMICSILYTFFYGFRKFIELKAKYSCNLLYENLKQIQKRKPNVYQYIKKQFSKQVIVFFIKICLGIIGVSILGALYSNLSQYFNWYKQSQNCTDTYMYSLIESYMIYFQSQRKNVLLSIILILTLLFIDLIVFFWRTAKDDLIGKDLEQIFQNSDQHKSDDKSSEGQSQDIDQKSIEIIQQARENDNKKKNQIYYTQEELISDYQKQNQKMAQIRRHKRMISIGDMTDFSEI